MKSRIEVFSRVLRILTVLMVIAVILFVFTVPVLAKGPESVTITGPGFEYPINMMDNNDIDLEVDLMEQTGLWFGTGRPLTSEALKGELGPSYTFTWVNSGPPSMTVEERTIIQHVYLDAEAGPVIHTPAQDSLQDWGSGLIGWFAAPGDLEDTLAKLGVPDSVSPPILEAHVSKTAGDTVLAKSTPTGFPWYLTIVGVALFGMFALLAVRLVKGRILVS